MRDVDADVGGDDETESRDLSRSSLIRLTALTRSFAMRLHDSIFLCVNQQAAGPKPLMLILILTIYVIIFSNKFMIVLCLCVQFFYCILI